MTTAAAPFTRDYFERLEEERLAVYASKSARAERPRGPVPSSPGDGRTNYARDRDRIVHSRAFRRLKHKTQVFIPYEGDHFRTRLTHTLEVAQIARSVARALGLNEDLTEAVAIGHDLGHTPYGHSGEYVLDRLLRESHPEAGGFKHNYQSVRVVDRLEKRYDEPGLNLTHDVREGVLKHTAWPRDFPFPLDFPEGLRFESGGSLEAQVVNWSDEIAQQTHDLEDGLPLTEETEIEELAIARQVRAARGWGSDPASRRASLIRGMIGVLCSDLVEGSRAKIDRWLERERITTPDEFYARRGRLPSDLVGFTDGGKKLYAELRAFVYRHIIHSFPVSRHDGHARRVMAGIFAAYRENPRLLPDDVLRGLAGELGTTFLREVPLAQIEREAEEKYRSRPEFYRTIADYMAGMTDSYCNSEYRQLVVE
jgi:dGTPase